MSDTPETDAAWKDCTPSDHKGLAILATMRKIERERDELRAKLQYVAGQLIDAGCDDGAAPVEELARRSKKDIASLRADVATASEQTAAVVRVMDGVVMERDALKADKARLDWLLQRGLCFRDADEFDPNWRVGSETEWLYESQEARSVIDAAMK